MARRRQRGRAVTGIIVVDKPTGCSSNHLLQRIKRLFNARKAGHTGSLDPLATGVLPICLGEATKVSEFLLDADKSYRVTCKLGTLTDSGDADGTAIDHQSVPPYRTADLRAVCQRFSGELQQVPPMYSALKHQGQPLYKLAREGIEVKRKARQIHIYDIRVITHDSHSFTLDVDCSKGTYIRTLVQDIAAELGTVGHVSALRRTEAAGFDLQSAYTLDELNTLAESGEQTLDQRLSAPEAALTDMESLSLDAEQCQRIGYGQRIAVEQTGGDRHWIKLFDRHQHFLGLGQLSDDGILAPKKLFVDVN